MITKYHGITSLSRMYAEKHGTTLKEGEKRVKEMVELLEEGLIDPNFDGIQFIDSFTLKRVVRKAKIGRNPLTKIEVPIPDRIGIKASIGNKLYKRLEN